MSHRNTVKRKNCFLYAHPFTGKNDSFRNYLISHFLSFPPLSKSQNRTLSLAPGKLRYCQSQWCFTFGRHPVDTKDVNYWGGLLWFGDLKGPYHFIKKVIYEAPYPPSTVIPLNHSLEFFNPPKKAPKF